MTNWQPTATLDALRSRAELMAAIRQFFVERNVLEVDTPVLGDYGVTDVHIDCIEANSGGKTKFLQTSPEYFMKRLLAFGSGDIYSVGKAFRNGETSRRHNPEFTLLEWYRVGWNEHQLIDETIEIAKLAMGDVPVTKLSYRDAFVAVLKCDPHNVEIRVLQELAAKVSGQTNFQEERSTCLDLLFSLAVEPKLPPGIVAIYDYPACQAALAQLAQDEQGETVARRFELFVDGMELANGYFELCDANEQRRRFEADKQTRQDANKKLMEADPHLIAAMESGLPTCAGVALGIDRLLIQALQVDSIEQVLAFPLR
jgi:lysyl-tRNA synthetase class 2